MKIEEKDKDFVNIFSSKMMRNCLLNRKQMVIEVIHPQRANVPKEELAERLAMSLNVDKNCCSIYGRKTKFGGKKSIGVALVYDTENDRNKYDGYSSSKKTLQNRNMRPTRRERKRLSRVNSSLNYRKKREKHKNRRIQELERKFRERWW